MKILNMKIEPMIYHAYVQGGEGDAHHVRIQAYNLDQEREFIGMEFNRIELRRHLDETGPLRSEHMNITFQEQLRKYHRAMAVAEAKREGEQNLIRDLLREAYGERSEITLVKISENQVN